MKKAINLIAAALMLSCGGSTAFMLPHYKEQKLKDVSLAIVVTPDLPIIENKYDVIDDLGEGTPEHTYLNYFAEIFPEYFHKRTFVSLAYIIDENEVAVRDTILDYKPDEQLQLKIPVNRVRVGEKKGQPDFVLLLQDLRIYAESGRSRNAIADTQGGNLGALHHVARFLMWDNSNKMLVSYGSLDTEKKVVFAMIKETWKAGISGLAEELVHCSPFLRKFPLNL